MPSNRSILQVLICLLSFSSCIWAQSDSLVLSSGVAAPGGTVPLSLSLTSPTGSEPAGLQWTLTFASSDVTNVNATTGSAADTAGKTLTCSAATGAYTCVLTGINSNVIQNGVVATVNVTVAPTVSSTSLGISKSLGASLAGAAITTAGTGGTITVSGGTSLTITSVACSPASVLTPGNTSCTVSLSAQVPSSSSATVALSSSNAYLTVPSSVSVPAGASSATFTASASVVTANQTASITGSLGASSQAASLTLVTPAVLSSVRCNPSTLNPGASSTCTATLNQAAQTNSTVALSSSNALLSVPGSVMVAAGATSANFAAAAGTFTTNQNATVTGTLGSSSQAASLALAVPTTVSSLQCTPSTINTGGASTCTLGLNQAAQSNVTVNVTSNNAALTVPGSVVVAGGMASATFTAAAGTFTTNQTAAVTATLNGGGQSVTLNLNASAAISGLQCSPAYLGAGGVTTCTVTLTQAAPTGGSTAAITTSNNWITSPASVSVPAGSTTATFSAQNSTTSPQGTVTVTAALNGTSQSFSLTTLGAMAVSSLTCKSASLAALSSTNCTVSMTQSAQKITVYLAANVSSALTLPASVIVNGRNDSFTVTATGSYSGAVTLAASYAGTWKSLQLTVAGTATNRISSLSCPASLDPGGSAQCTAQLAEAAPEGGSTLEVRANNRRLQAPDRVYVAGGNRTAAFSIRSVAAEEDESATVSASISGVPASTRVSLAGLRIASLACDPKTVTAGESARCEVRLSAAPASAVDIKVAADSGSLRVPGVITSRPHQAVVSFLAETAPNARQHEAALKAAIGTTTVQQRMIVLPSGAPFLEVPENQFVRPGEALSFAVSATDGRDLPIHITVTGLPRGARFDASTNLFRWMPEKSQIGSHAIAFTATNSASSSRTEQVKVEVGSGRPAPDSVRNAASLSEEAACSPGSLSTISGGWLSAGDPVTATSRGITELAGSRVLVDGEAAELVYASATRIDFVCPNHEPGKLPVIVETQGGPSSPVSAVVQSASPGIMSLDGSGQGRGQVLISGISQYAIARNFRYPGQPAQPGDLATLRVTGVPDTFAARVMIAGMDAEIKTMRASAELAGIQEIDVRIPAGSPLGEEVPLWLELRSPSGQVLRSNVVTLAVETLLP